MVLKAAFDLYFTFVSESNVFLTLGLVLGSFGLSRSKRSRVSSVCVLLPARHRNKKFWFTVVRIVMVTGVLYCTRDWTFRARFGLDVRGYTRARKRAWVRGYTGYTYLWCQ